MNDATFTPEQTELRNIAAKAMSEGHTRTRGDRVYPHPPGLMASVVALVDAGRTLPQAWAITRAVATTHYPDLLKGISIRKVPDLAPAAEPSTERATLHCGHPVGCLIENNPEPICGWCWAQVGSRGGAGGAAVCRAAFGQVRGLRRDRQRLHRWSRPVNSTQVYADLKALVGDAAADLLQEASMIAAVKSDRPASAWFAWALDRMRAGEKPEAVARSYGWTPPAVDAAAAERDAQVERGVKWLEEATRYMDEPLDHARDALRSMPTDDVAEAIRATGGLDELPALLLLDMIAELRRRAEDAEVHAARHAALTATVPDASSELEEVAKSMRRAWEEGLSAERRGHVWEQLAPGVRARWITAADVATRELRRRVTALESLLDSFRHEAKIAIDRRNNPGGQHAGTPAWASVPLSVCLAVVRDVGHAIGPPKAPGGAP